MGTIRSVFSVLGRRKKEERGDSAGAEEQGVPVLDEVVIGKVLGIHQGIRLRAGQCLRDQ